MERLNGHLDIAKVVYWQCGMKEWCLEWIECKPPALGGLCAVDCVMDKKLIKRLKECMLRMD